MDLLVKGGWVMLPLIICSLVAVTVVMERWFYFRHFKVSEQAEKIISLIAQGNFDDAFAIAQNAKTPTLRILAAGILQKTVSAKAMETAATQEIAAMKKGLPVLDTIITLSPLLGLLGTIIGMIESFQVMANGGLAQPHAVTGGVAEALIATASGICVAVTALIPYNYFLARIERETEVIEQYATRFEIALVKAPRSEAYDNSKKYA